LLAIRVPLGTLVLAAVPGPDRPLSNLGIARRRNVIKGRGKPQTGDLLRTRADLVLARLTVFLRGKTNHSKARAINPSDLKKADRTDRGHRPSKLVKKPPTILIEENFPGRRRILEAPLVLGWEVIPRAQSAD